MYHALGDALVVEVEDFLAEVKVLDQRWPALTDLQSVLVVRYRAALSGREDLGVALGYLVKFASVPPRQLLIMDRRGLPDDCLVVLAILVISILENGRQITLNVP